ncbi:MAG TPA: aldehyde dehydrogenase family protein [Candidatus Limnocylindria bacterium]|nr:aldehyde dehydrogenase family protein [Candidatus Limnocylindria bacterium]
MTTATATARDQRMLIGGEWVDAADRRTFAVETPARRGEVIAQVPRAGAADVDRAVRAAHAAFPEWRAMVPRERGRILTRIADDLDAAVEDLARLCASETGNAIRTQARPEAKTTADLFRYFGGLGGELKGETVPLGDANFSYTRREPWGVVAAIVPWNVPILISAWKLAPALLAGNTVVLKPSANAPLAALALARICDRHLPKGVLSVVTGTGDEVGTPLAEHALIAKISFTGNTETGKAILRAAADRILPVTLELGGKSPQIVFADSDNDRTADGVIAGMRFARQGQSCTAGSRLFVHQSVFDSFLERLATKLRKMKVGDPLDEASDMGAIVSRQQFESVCRYIDEGTKQEGARTVVGGLPPKSGPLAAGYYIEPTVFASERNDWRLAREEIFGPVLVAIPWTDEADAIRMANDSHYGLAAYVWCNDITRALRTAHALDAGWIQVNQGGGQVVGQPYGGYKQSGLGRENSLEGMLESFTQRKTVNVNLTA